MFMQAKEQGNKAMEVFQTGLTGCFLSYDRVHSVMPGFGIDDHRSTPVTQSAAQSNGSIHRKVREERKAEEQKSLRPLRSLRLIEFHGG